MRCANLIKKIRSAYGVSRKEFAEVLGVSFHELVFYESGNCLPNMSVITQLINLARVQSINASIEDFSMCQSTLERLESVSPENNIQPNEDNKFETKSFRLSINAIKALDKLAERIANRAGAKIAKGKVIELAIFNAASLSLDDLITNKN